PYLIDIPRHPPRSPPFPYTTLSDLMLHPDDAAELGIEDGARVEIGNHRGEVVLHAKLFDGVRRGVVIAEGIWPNDAHERGEGIKDRKSTRLNSSHVKSSYAVFCLKK